MNGKAMWNSVVVPVLRFSHSFGTQNRLLGGLSISSQYHSHPVDHFSLPFNNFLPIDWEFNRSRKLYNFELKLYVSFRALMRIFLVASPNIKDFSYWN